MWGQHFWGSADVRRKNSWKRQLCHVETLSGLSLLSIWKRKHFTWGRRNTSMAYIWCIWNRLFFLINRTPPLHWIWDREATGLLTGSYISVSHCSDVAMLGFATVFTLRGGGGLKKREFYRQNRCLIPRLAISRKLLSIQIKVSNLWLQRLPGEAVVHLKSSKWDIRHLKTPPDRCWNMHCQGRIVRLIVLNSFQTERIQQHRYLRFVAVIAYIVVFFVLVRKLWGL